MIRFIRKLTEHFVCKRIRIKINNLINRGFFMINCSDFKTVKIAVSGCISEPS